MWLELSWRLEVKMVSILNYAVKSYPPSVFNCLVRCGEWNTAHFGFYPFCLVDSLFDHRLQHTMSRASVLIFALLAVALLKEAVATWPPACPEKWCKAAKKRDDSVIRKAIKNREDEACYCACDLTFYGKRLLHLTACAEAVTFADLMISKEPNCYVDVRDRYGHTPLHDAAECCNTPMAYVSLSALGFEFGQQPC